MGDEVIAWRWEKMPELIVWVGGLNEWQMVAAGMGGLLLIYAVVTAAYNGWLMVTGMSGRIISNPARWDDEPYEEWMAEVWQ